MKKKGIIALASTLTLAGVAAVSSIGIAVGNNKRNTADNTGNQSINQTIYTVTFDTNGGIMADTEQHVTGGNTLTAPTATRSGYDFLGWYTDEACTQKFDFNATPISSNITLYAKWGNKYTVNFNTLGGSEIAPVRIVEGGQVAIPTAPTKTGFTFAGWYKDEDCTQVYDFETPVTAEFTLYAKWNVLTYNVTFDTCGYGELPSQQIYYGGKINEPSMWRSGYEIEGWYLDSEYHEKFDFDTRIESNLKLYVKWVIDITYDCEFELRHGSNSDDYFVLKRYSGGATEIEIPNTPAVHVGSSPITAIGNNAFENCQTLTKVTLTENINSIGNNAFDNCENLEMIDKLDTVNYIGSEAFKNCTSLTKIVIPSSVGFIGAGAFDGCTNLKIYCEASTRPNSWDDNWLDGFDEDNVVWVSGIVEGDYAFKSINGGSEYAVKAYLGEAGDLVIPESCKGKPVTAIAENAFYERYGIYSVVMPDTINHVGDGAFRECRELRSVKLSKNVTNIGEYVFAYTTSLSSFIIPDTVTSISSYAFDTSGLMFVYIPNSVVAIGDCAFDCSYYLWDVYCESKFKPDTWEGLFRYGEGEEPYEWNSESINWSWGCEIHDGFVYKPIDNENAWEICFYVGNSSVVVIPEFYKGKPVSIGQNAFQCTDAVVKKIVIPENVEIVGDDAFARDVYFNNYIIYCATETKPSNWSDTWGGNYNTILWGNQWHYDENGNPVPNE